MLTEVAVAWQGGVQQLIHVESRGPEGAAFWMQGFVGRSLGDPGLKPSVRVGEAAMREVAAFLLDHEHFASVPHTVMVKVSPCCGSPSPPKVAAGDDEAQLPLLIREDISGMESNYIRHC